MTPDRTDARELALWIAKAAHPPTGGSHKQRLSRLTAFGKAYAAALNTTGGSHG
jgi:hypothetical protein